jgi:hypothetical protein
MGWGALHYTVLDPLRLTGDGSLPIGPGHGKAMHVHATCHHPPCFTDLYTALASPLMLTGDGRLPHHPDVHPAP